MSYDKRRLFMNPDYTITPDGVLTYVKPETRVLELPKNIIAIDRDAFRDCRNTLEQLILLGHIRLILAGTFACFKKLKTVEFRGGVDYLEAFSFYNNKELRSFIIKKTLKCMDESCLEGCIKLPFINILDTVEYIGDDACKGCIELEVNIAKNGTDLKLYTKDLETQIKKTNSKVKIPKKSVNVVKYYLSTTALTDCKFIIYKHETISDFMIGGRAAKEKIQPFIQEKQDIDKLLYPIKINQK